MARVDPFDQVAKENGYRKSWNNKTTPLTINENIGAGYINPNGIANAKMPVQPVGHRSQRFDLQVGDWIFPIHDDLNNIVSGTLIVYKNGMALTQDKDYRLNYEQGTLDLRYPSLSNDDDLEIRYQYYFDDAFVYDDVLLLHRYGPNNFEFSMEQLEQLRPETNDRFKVDKLLSLGNAQLYNYAGKEAIVLSSRADEQIGIIGKIRIV